MKNLNIDNIFSAFDSEHDSDQPNNNIDQVDDQCYRAFAKLFTGVENFYMLDYLYTTRYQQSYNSVRQTIQVKCYSILLQNVDRYGKLQSDTVKKLKDQFGKSVIEFALNDMLDCFLQIENYEACSKIHKFIKKFKVKNLH